MARIATVARMPPPFRRRTTKKEPQRSPRSAVTLEERIEEIMGQVREAGHNQVERVAALEEYLTLARAHEGETWFDAGARTEDLAGSYLALGRVDDAVSSLADAVCVSGAVTGTGAAFADLVAAKDAVGPETAVIANTGVRPSTVGDILRVVDGCIVGTSLKHDGITWNAVDRSRVDALLDAAEASGSWLPSAASRRVAAPVDSGGGT